MEQHTTELTSLMIVVTIAFLVPILLHRLHLKIIPVVVAEIIAGLIIGKSGLNLITEDPWLELLSLFGFIYLLFLSGLEIDFASFKKKKSAEDNNVNPLILSVIILIGVFAVSLGLSYVLLWINLIEDPLLMTLIIATISLGVVVPVLKEKKIMDTPLGQIILLVAVLSDFATMILLAVYISYQSQNIEQMLLLLVFFALVVFTYLFLKNFVRGKLFDVLRKSTAQMGTRAVFALILLFVVLSETFEIENILGAFLAGVVVSLLAPDKKFVHQLESFGYGFLIPIFFVMLGVNLNLWDLLTDLRILILIPMLLAAIFLSKIIPILILKRYFPWRHVIGSGLLLSSTLSLVIAAAALALQIGAIDETMHGALILVAVISCLIAPILFNQIFPQVTKKPKSISIIGANHVTLPISQDLIKEGYEVKLFSAESNHADSKEETFSQFPLIEIPNLDEKSLEDQDAFKTDIIVFGTMDDEINLALGKYAKTLDISNIIVRIEKPDLFEEAQDEEGLSLFSTLYASRTLLKALIEHPSALRLITHHDGSIGEVTMNNQTYHDEYLHNLPLLGNMLILRIYRGDSFIIPHGNTQIELGDRLLVSGDVESILEMKSELE
ncbi:cation:proton antiporter family protein [Chengkuizengella axinellae]|uniref:Cation:proton antiporter n=1 Tax=Chengkuizengella axinellae TaxID=3064388 RepID=A0ABT9J5E5_9BACL|nr:cation:proton antiporter family protein [Chengkuizengella sp. 2205SS18-9]MDP5276225.1 cation:proton antiporter [Chengkuizengella sp. 2205SS18-9]